MSVATCYRHVYRYTENDKIIEREREREREREMKICNVELSIYQNSFNVVCIYLMYTMIVYPPPPSFTYLLYVDINHLIYFVCRGRDIYHHIKVT